MTETIARAADRHRNRVRQWALRVSAPLLGVMIIGAGPKGGAPTACFSPGPGQPAGLEMFQQSPPPIAGLEAGSIYFPATAFATQSIDRIWKAPAGRYKLYYFQWGNRADEAFSRLTARGNHKANFEPGEEGAQVARASFTDVDKANGCTLAQTAAALGLPPVQVDDFVLKVGVRPMRLAAGSRDGLAGARDACVLPTRALPPTADGVMIDYEVQDGRTAAQTRDFLQRFTSLVRSAGKSPLLLIDPFDAESQAMSGVDVTNARALVSMFDRTTLFAWSRNRQRNLAASLESQWAMLSAGGDLDPKRLIIDFELAGTSQSDAATARRFMETHNLAGALFWRNNASQGGPCDNDVNRKIACLGFGKCEAAG